MLSSEMDWAKSTKSLQDVLIEELETQKNLMISVSTGGPRIQTKNEEYKKRQEQISANLAKVGIKNGNPHKDLWEWYGKWSSGDLPTYQSRRQYFAELFNPMLEKVKQLGAGFKSEIFHEPTGWERVDRTMGEIRFRLGEAKNEEQFQAIGLLCREALISLAQVVYDPSVHIITEGPSPSKTDAKRMLEAYLATELSGSTNEAARRHAKAALDLANDLTHRRTATFRLAALCSEATSAVVNLIAIISGQRDPL